MDGKSKGFATAHGRADFFSRIKAGDYLEAVLYDGDNWAAVDGRAVHTSHTHIWWAETGKQKRLRKTHKFRCTPVPSPEEIRERAAEIKAGWSESEKLKRGKSLHTALDNLASEELYAQRKKAAHKYRTEQRYAEAARRFFNSTNSDTQERGIHGHS